MQAIDRRLVEEELRDAAAGWRLVVLDATGSTNDEALRLALAGAASGTVVLAAEQSAGRGRLGRPWYSPRGGGLYVSVLFRPARPPVEAPRWSLAAAAAACLACRPLAGDGIHVKWPNDLVWQGRKVAGTLVEQRGTASAVDALVVGTGFNVNALASDFPLSLRADVASLRMIRGGDPVPLAPLAAAYLSCLGAMSGELEAGNWGPVRDAWLALAPGARGRRVRVVPDGGGLAWEGVTRGLEPDGALRVERSDGTVSAVHVGESLVPMES